MCAINCCRTLVPTVGEWPTCAALAQRPSPRLCPCARPRRRRWEETKGATKQSYDDFLKEASRSAGALQCTSAYSCLVHWQSWGAASSADVDCMLPTCSAWRSLALQS